MTDREIDRIDLRGDGRVILYRREGLKRPVWQTRIRVPNATGYKVVTTKTEDEFEARRFALNLYEELYLHVKAGGSIQSKTFKQVYDEWASHASAMGRTKRDGSWDATFERIASYSLDFFGNCRIDSITVADFTDYWRWRRTNYQRKAPTNNTLRRERTSILPVFKYALSKGYITKMPETNPPKPTAERRPTFSSEEWGKISSASAAWVEQAVELATWRDRFMARHCFRILANTGLRIGELRGLRWCDIWSVENKDGENPRKYFAGYVSGKTGGRQFVFQPGAEMGLYSIWIQRCKDLLRLDPDLEDPSPDRTEPIFCHPDGRAIKEFKHSFRSLLEFAGVPIEADGKPRTIYSLRHFYATTRLSLEASPYLVASQMGTSVEMLEQHYGQVINSKVAAQITGRTPFDVTVTGGFKLPF